MSTEPGQNKIPPSTAPFFQEYTFDSLEINQDASLIIERILGYGSRAEVRWLLDTYGRNRVREWLARFGVRGLSRRRYHLWCFVFEIPEARRRAGIWPY